MRYPYDITSLSERHSFDMYDLNFNFDISELSLVTREPFKISRRVKLLFVQSVKHDRYSTYGTYIYIRVKRNCQMRFYTYSLYSLTRKTVFNYNYK